MPDEPSQVAADPQSEAEQASQPASETEKRDTEHNWFNRTIRGVASAVKGAVLALDEPEDKEAETPPEPQPETPAQISEAEAAERERRAAQSERDRITAQTRWDQAISAADQDDPRLLTELAEAGNQRAERELERRGLTYELGQVRASTLRAADHVQAQDGLIKTVAAAFDEAVLNPLLAALPEDEQRAILGESGIAGMDGRKAAAEAAVNAIRRRAVSDAISDERVARALLAPDSAFRKALLANPTSNKSLRALFRGELDEPELLRGLEAGYGGETEAVVMNTAIRRAARATEERAPAERAAGAGRSRRDQNRDALEDDE